MQHLEIKIADREGISIPIGQQGKIWARSYPIMVIQREKKKRKCHQVGIEQVMKMVIFTLLDVEKKNIIRGGGNTYPIEIENTIVEHPSVAKAQVFSIPEQRYGEEVCA